MLNNLKLLIMTDDSYEPLNMSNNIVRMTKLSHDYPLTINDFGLFSYFPRIHLTLRNARFTVAVAQQLAQLF